MPLSTWPSTMRVCQFHHPGSATRDMTESANGFGSCPKLMQADYRDAGAGVKRRQKRPFDYGSRSILNGCESG